MGRFFAWTVILCVLCPAAGSGIVMEGTEEAFIGRVYIAEDVLRVDVREEDDEREGRIIFRRGNRDFSLYVIDETDRTYYEITAGDMARVKKQIDDFLEMVEAALRDVPEEHRDQAILELQLVIPPEFAGILRTMDLEKKVVREETSVEKGGWICDRFVVYYNGTKSSEAWFADAGQFGMKGEDFKILREFDRFLEIPAAGLIPGFLTLEVEAQDSIPVRIVEFGEDGEEVVNISIEHLGRDDIDPSAFEIPEGFERMEIEF